MERLRRFVNEEIKITKDLIKEKVIETCHLTKEEIANLDEDIEFRKLLTWDYMKSKYARMFDYNDLESHAFNIGRLYILNKIKDEFLSESQELKRIKV